MGVVRRRQHAGDRVTATSGHDSKRDRHADVLAGHHRQQWKRRRLPDGVAGPILTNFFVDAVGNTVKNACPWDVDGEANVGAADLLALLVNWGPCP
ncbi:MAG: hypothetical protein V3T53_10040 [Phycisphaerales bacterium]